MDNVPHLAGMYVTSSYVLITPVRNEREHIDQLAHTVLSQTLRPKFWIVAVDSNSSDGTYEAAVEKLRSYDWVKVITAAGSAPEGYSHRNFARTVNAALGAAFSLGKDVEYIGKTDAEVRLDPNYFEHLIEVMDADSSLVITCGVQRFEIEGASYKLGKGSSDPLVGFNDIRLYRKGFLEEMGGYPISYSPDTVLQIKALNKGLRTEVIPQVTFVKKRQGATKIGLWDGHVLRGKGLYALGYRPSYALFYSLYYTRFPPHYQFLPLMYGYAYAIGHKGERVEDMEVLEYYSRRSLLSTIISIIGGMKV